MEAKATVPASTRAADPNMSAPSTMEARAPASNTAMDFAQVRDVGHGGESD
jgi:hypothetical protein